MKDSAIMGDYTKRKYYPTMEKVLAGANIYEADNPNTARANKLHEILINYREDFIWGYENHSKMVIYIQTRLANTLIHMTDTLIYKNRLKNPAFEKRANQDAVEADFLIHVFNSGEWNKIMAKLRD